MKEKILSKIPLYYGEIKIPESWEIDREVIARDILSSTLFNKKFPFSIEWDVLNTYIIEHLNAIYGEKVINKDSWGNIYNPNECSPPLKELDPMDPVNSPDYVMLYGVKLEKNSCFIRIYYDDNKNKGNWWDIPLEENNFIIFPSSQTYHISKNKSVNLNMIQTITYVIR